MSILALVDNELLVVSKRPIGLEDGATYNLVEGAASTVAVSFVAFLPRSLSG